MKRVSKFKRPYYRPGPEDDCVSGAKCSTCGGRFVQPMFFSRGLCFNCYQLQRHEAEIETVFETIHEQRIRDGWHELLSGEADD